MTESVPLISIVTSSLNSGRYIEQAIRSIKAQTNPKFEHIIVDGCSTDETPSIIEKYRDTYDLKVIREPDKGISDAVNKGIRKAKGEVIGLMNADDLLLPWSLALVAEAFSRVPDCDCVYGDTLQMPMGAKYAHINFSPRPDEISRHLAFDGMLSMSMFWKKERVTNLGLFDESFRFTNDYDLEIRATRAGFTFYKLDSPLACFRWRYSGMSIRDPSAFKEEIARIRHAHFAGRPISVPGRFSYEVGRNTAYAAGLLRVLGGESVLHDAGLVSSSRLLAYVLTAPFLQTSTFLARRAQNGFVDVSKLMTLIMND